VQREATTLGGAPVSAAGVQQAAAQGISGGSSSLPHSDAIQSSFGHHDVSNVQAHTDSAAQSASRAMGAEAYATGSHVAFGSSTPSLHTAAHEAAHVVQQRSGVSLKGGVGEVGDSYEQHADAVADRVVQGKSATDLLDQYAPGGGGGAVQQKAVQFDIKDDIRASFGIIFTDSDAIIGRLERATPQELQLVIADATLMEQMRSKLSRSNMLRALDDLHAPLPDKLRMAMRGWGRDTEYIQRVLMLATPAELQVVAADTALVNQLQSELSGDDIRRVLDRLQVPLSRKLQYAIAGWGTDEQYIYTSVSTAPIAEVVAVATNNALIAQVDDDLSGSELDQWRGLLARRLHADASNDMVAFRMCMGADANRRRRLTWVGDITVQRAVCDYVILNSTDGDTVRQAFQSYWEVELTTAAGATTWPPATLKAMHQQLKLLPSQDTRARVWRELQLTSDPSLIDRAAYGGGVFSVGSNASTGSAIPMGYGTKLTAPAAVGATTITVEENRFTVGNAIDIDPGDGTSANKETVTITAIAGTVLTIDPALTKAHSPAPGRDVFVGASGGGGLRNVNWLNATVRHEIAHAVDGVVDCSGFKQGIGGWGSSTSIDDWIAQMNDPWHTSDGSVISTEDRNQIKSTVQEYVTGAKGTMAGLPATNAVIKHWGKNVPVIVGAEACLSQGDNFFNSPTTLLKNNSKVFSCSAWYKVFQWCNEGVMTDRLSNYTLYAGAEFFAETYTVFYEEAGTGITDAELGRHVKNGGWASWIRTNVHDRGHAPAPTGGTPAPAPSGPPSPEAPARPGDGRPGGGGHGKQSHNPN
jgi:hypothetical protein